MKITYQKINKRAKDLDLGDSIKIGGLMYEIVKIDFNDYNEIVLGLSIVALQKPFGKDPAQNATLIIPKKIVVTTLM